MAPAEAKPQRETQCRPPRRSVGDLRLEDSRTKRCRTLRRPLSSAL